MTGDHILITVDGQLLGVEHATPLLPALRAHGFDIPGLCYHPRLGEQGRCSLCVVEVRNHGNWQVQHACMLRCKPGLDIRTVSAHIHRLRSWAARMLLARGPFNEPSAAGMLHEVLAAAERGGSEGECHDAPASPCLGSDKPVPASRAMPSGCILCGRCISMCTRIGKNKLVFLGRGKRFRIGYVDTPSDTEACGTCSACRSVCPTAFIRSNGQAAFSAKLYRKRELPRKTGNE
jgi:NADH dehydrogenase/NADH:ubiquinone oxidoreductase subunit G